jgi:hypothetical protein
MASRGCTPGDLPSERVTRNRGAEPLAICTSLGKKLRTRFERLAQTASQANRMAAYYQGREKRDGRPMRRRPSAQTSLLRALARSRALGCLAGALAALARAIPAVSGRRWVRESRCRSRSQHQRCERHRREFACLAHLSPPFRRRHSCTPTLNKCSIRAQVAA